MRRRNLLRGLGVTVTASISGCTKVLAGNEDGSTNDQVEGNSCNQFAFTDSGATPESAFPWHLHFRNISLSVYSVSVVISDISGGSADEDVSCAATSEAHEKLIFDLSSESKYRFHVTLNRPENPEEAITTVTGGQIMQENAALEVTVGRDVGFTIRHVHYDPGITVTSTP
jgi:hypothetical protein